MRQLRNVVEKMVVLSAGGRLTIDDVPPEVIALAAHAPLAPSAATAPSSTQAFGAKPLSLAEAEKERILSAIAECRNNKTKAAEMLGVSRRTLHRKLREWGLAGS